MLSGTEFQSAKYKEILQPGYTAKPDSVRRAGKGQGCAASEKDGGEGMVLPVVRAEKKQGFTSPPKVYTDVIFCERKEWIGIEERSSA